MTRFGGDRVAFEIDLPGSLLLIFVNQERYVVGVPLIL